MMGAEADSSRRRSRSSTPTTSRKRLAAHYPVLYQGKAGFVAHECIFDLRAFKESAGIEVEDIAKRLMDYGFHAPTISFPVPGTLMVEPTESEGKEELDRFCEAMIAIREEIAAIESGKADRENNVLKNAPHTAEQVDAHANGRVLIRVKWPRCRRAWVRENKFWPSVGRINTCSATGTSFAPARRSKITFRILHLSVLDLSSP